MNDPDFDIVLVAALDEARVIGHRGDLPWHLPADLRHFKETTMGHPLLMGRRTHESIGTALPGRDNIVLTGRDDYQPPGCTIAHSLEEAFDHVEATGADKAMVVGGETVFRQILPLADRMVLTVVAGRHEGDVFFPNFADDQWNVVDTRPRPADEDNENDMVFVRLEATVETPRTMQPVRTPGRLSKPLKNALREATGE